MPGAQCPPYPPPYAPPLGKAGLDAIAITDHHDLFFAKYVRDAARLERGADGKVLPADKQIVVFPGMELTLNVPCQALLLFDADFL
jgi:chromosome segregation protein